MNIDIPIFMINGLDFKIKNFTFINSMIIRLSCLLLLLMNINSILGQSKVIFKDTMTIYFNNNVYQADSIDSNKIKKYYRDLDEKILDSILLEGYANSIGDVKSNLLLSQKRVEEIKHLIKELNLSIKIIAQGYGEINGSLLENRRVDIITYYREKKKIKILRGINFVPGNDLILKESENALLDLLNYVKDNPKSNFILYGHICCSGNVPPEQDGLNSRLGTRTLSKDRSRAVYNYLIQRGISPERLKFEGKAYTEPLGGEDHLDRRVEIEEIIRTE